MMGISGSSLAVPWQYDQPLTALTAGTTVLPSGGVRLPAGLYHTIQVTLDVGDFALTNSVTGILMVSLDGGATWQPNGAITAPGGASPMLNGGVTTLRIATAGNADEALRSFLSTHSMLVALELTVDVPGNITYTLEFLP